MSETMERPVGAFSVSRKHPVSLRVLAPTLVSVLLGCVGWAQEFRATITGTVSDASGAKVANAKIEVKNQSTGATVTAETTGEGTYNTPFLTPGRYSVTATMSGFKTETKTNIELNVGDRQQLDFALQVGGVSEQVTVEASSQQLETATADLGQTIGTAATAELPLLGRNPFQLTTLASGVQHTPTTASRSDRPFDNGGMDAYNINGSRSFSNEFLLDGAPNDASENNLQPNNIAIAPPPDAVAESKVQTSTYDAQYGRTGGGTVNVGLKSGTNSFHANLYDYWRNTVLNANTFDGNLSGQGKVPFHWNQPGVEVEGPLYIPKLYDGRNRTFFMYNWEDVRDSVPFAQVYTVATTAERAGDFSGLRNATGQPVTIYDPLSTNPATLTRTPFAGNMIPQNRIDPVARNMLQYLPLPNVPGNGFGQNNFSIPSNTRSDRYDIHSFRFDHAINDQNKFFVDVLRSNRHEVNGTAGFVGPASPLYLHWRINTGVVGDWTSIISPTTVLDSRVSFVRHVFAIARHANGFDPTQLGWPSSLVSQLPALSFPQMNVGTYYSNGNFTGFGYTGSTYTYTNNFSWSETLSKTLSAHSVRTGMNFRIIRNNYNSPTSSAGSFTFSPVFTQQNPTQASAISGDSFASFLLGTPASGSVQSNSAFAYQTLYTAAFLQDDWRVSSRLTINLGGRWDYEAPTSERYNRQNAGFDFGAVSPLQVPNFRTLYGGLLFTGNSSKNRLPFRRDLNNFQPRIGFAYKITNSTVFRGGWGITYLPTFDTGQNNGYGISTAFVASTNGNVTPANFLSNPFPTGILQPVGSTQGLATLLGQNITYSNPGRKIPHIQQFSAQLQQQLPGNMLLGVSYAGSRTDAIQVAKQINVLPTSALALNNALLTPVANPFQGRLPGSNINGATVPLQQLLLPHPQFGTITSFSNSFGYSSFDSLQVNLDKRLSHGLYYILSYTYSKSLEVTSYMNAQDPFDRPARSISPFDAPHRFTAAGGYALPFFKNSTGLRNIVLGGWQMNAMVYFQSGLPIPAPTTSGAGVSTTTFANSAASTTFYGGAVSTGISPVIDSPDIFARQFNTCTITLTGTRQNCTSASQPAAWRIQSPYELNTLSVLIPSVRTQRPAQVNASIFKTFNMTEALHLQFRAEAFNLTNTPWFGGPTTAVNSASFGQVAKVQVNDARSFQLALRLSF